METLDDKAATYRGVRKNATLWGSIHTCLAFVMAAVAGIAGDEKTMHAAFGLALAIAAISVLVIIFTVAKLKMMEPDEAPATKTV